MLNKQVHEEVIFVSCVCYWGRMIFQDNVVIMNKLPKVLCRMNDIISVNDDNSDGSSSSSASRFTAEEEEAFQLEHPDLYVKTRIEDHHFLASTAKNLFIEQGHSFFLEKF